MRPLSLRKHMEAYQAVQAAPATKLPPSADGIGDRSSRTARTPA